MFSLFAGRRRLGARASRRRVRRMTPRLHVADSPLEALEARALLSALMIDSIYRTTSLSPFNGPIRDQVALSPSLAGSLAGKADTLVGYQVTVTYPTKNPNQPIAGPYDYGGTGFEVDFTNTTGEAPTVKINWGGQEGSVSNTFTAPTITSITVPHVYLQTGTYLVVITVSAGGQSTTADISTTVSHVLSEPSGIFIIGDQNPDGDQVLLNQEPDGMVMLTSNFLPSNGQPVAIGKAPSVYVQTLQGKQDVIKTTEQFRDSLWVDAGASNVTIVDNGSGSDHLSGGPGVNVITAAGSGNDFLYGGSGNDMLMAPGKGNDVLYGGSGNETLIGGPGQDQLFGGAGKDMLIAGKGNTFMLSGLGSGTILQGGAGKDILIGGYDNAEYEYRPQFVQQIMADWASGNYDAVKRELTGSNTFGANFANNGKTDVLYGGSGENLLVPHVVGKPYDDVVHAQPSDKILELHDLPVPTVNVQFVNPTKYVSTSGADIIGNPTHTTIVLGRNSPDNYAIINELGSPLIEPGQFNTYYDVPHPGSLLVLYVNTSAPNFWTEYDRPYVNDGLSRGDFFIMSSNTFDPITLYNPKGDFMGLPTFLGYEVEYMVGQYDQNNRPPALPSYAYDPMRHTFFMT